jgi:hypothetical protein
LSKIIKGYLSAIFNIPGRKNSTTLRQRGNPVIRIERPATKSLNLEKVRRNVK